MLTRHPGALKGPALIFCLFVGMSIMPGLRVSAQDDNSPIDFTPPKYIQSAPAPAPAPAAAPSTAGDTSPAVANAQLQNAYAQEAAAVSSSLGQSCPLDPDKGFDAGGAFYCIFHPIWCYNCFTGGPLDKDPDLGPGPTPSPEPTRTNLDNSTEDSMPDPTSDPDSSGNVSP